MIGRLPKSLNIGGIEYKIRSDFRVALLIFEAFEDPELSEYEKTAIMLECIYETVPDDVNEAVRLACWFLDGGDIPKSKPSGKPTFDWKQDEGIFFPAINKAAGKEVRELDYLHWWTFLGYFNEIGEGFFSEVMSIRQKKAKGKKLEKYEREFYAAHKNVIDIKPRYTADEKAEIDRLNSLLGE